MRNVGQNPWNWSSVKRYSPSFRRSGESLLARVGNPDFARPSDESAAKVSLGPGTSIRQRQKDDLSRYSIPALLHYEDRNSMAHSIEARVPMLDYQLASFAVNCRTSLKLRNGWTKWILRKAMRGILPEAVRLRKTKLGFSTPQQKWLREDARGTIRSLIHNRVLKLERILSPRKVSATLGAFLDRNPGSLTELEAYRVLNLELWARVFSVS
jgi:asparagine synthase (glutamine-hydrolysing)